MRYLILGSSAAGINAAIELRKIDQECNIIVASKDDILVSRCILHHYIEGRRDETQLHFAGPNVIKEHNIEFLKGYVATSLDENAKSVTFSNGETIDYDKVLIATGSSSFIPPVPNLREGKQVFGLRDLEDAIAIKDQIKDGMKIVIIGSGLVGMDALESLVHYNVEVHLVDLADHLLSLQLDDVAAKAYFDLAQEYNVHGHFSTLAKDVELDADGNVLAINLDNGEHIDADMIIVATGTKANIDFLSETSIETTRAGLTINDLGETNVADVYGAGDVTGAHPIWPMAVKEGIIAASNMAGIKKEMDDFFASKSTMNFFGLKTMSVGSVKPDEGVTFKVLHTADSYKKIAIKDGIIVGAILQNDIDYCGILTQLVKCQIKIDTLDKDIFRLDYADFYNLDENIEFKF